MMLKGSVNATQQLKGNALPSDGFSPIVAVEKTDFGHEVTITDRYGTNVFDVLDGKDGEKGETGEFPLEQVKKDFSASIKNNASGETVVVTDSANATPLGMKLFGKYEQNTVAGNQLLNLPNVDSVTHRGITWSCNNGVVKLSGTSESVTDSTHPLIGLYYDFPIKAGTYYISGSKNKAQVFVAVTIADGSIKYYTERSFVLDGTETTCRIYMGIQSAEATVNETIYPMFNEGTTALTFEPFVGGEPSPNLNYKQDVVPHGASGQIEQKFLNSNIYDTSLFVTASSNGITRELVNGKIHFYGTATTSGNFRLINPNTIRYGKNGKVTLSIQNISGTFYRVGVNSHNNNNWVNIGSLDKNNGYTSVFELGDYDIIPFVMYEQGVTYDTYFDFVVNYGEQSFPYEPYSEQVLVHQTPNGLGGIPLGQTIPSAIANSPIHMSGVYWDNATSQYWIGDTKENGQNVQRIGVEVVSNTPNFIETSDQLGRFLWSSGNRLKNVYLNGDIPAMFNYAYWCFWGNRNTSTAKNTTNDYSAISGRNLYFNPNVTMTADEVNAKFTEMIASDAPPVVVGVLATPIVTDLTDEEKAQYSNVHMNYPNTTIVNSDNAYTEVEYVADTKCYIDNKFKELETNITSAVAQLL